MPEGASRAGPDAELERRWARVRSAMHGAEHWLRRRGAVVPKDVDRRRYWVVRYDVVDEQGRRRRRSIHVGSDDQAELLRRTRALLERYRSEGRWSDELAALTRLAGAAASLGRELARDILI